MTASSIEWTDETWNPIRGCTRVSEGCRNCYAETMAARDLPGMRSPTTGKPFAVRKADGPHWTGAVELIPLKLDEPLRWRKPRRVFVNSMSDLFHESLKNGEINRIFSVMSMAKAHTFQVLTKRPRRMLDFHSWAYIANATVKQWPLPNVWLGVSVEDQATADERIPLLLQTPAAKRFVSYEPALGPVDFSMDHECGDPPHPRCPRLPDWIIVGGESGPGARPFDVSWARSTVRQCREAGVACFVKQLGAHVINGVEEGREKEWLDFHWPDTPDLDFDMNGRVYLKSKKGGDMAEWPEDLRVREFPA